MSNKMDAIYQKKNDNKEKYLKTSRLIYLLVKRRTYNI